MPETTKNADIKEADNLAVKKKKSVVPVYALALTWLIYSLRNPMYKLKNILICALISTAVYFIARLIWKPKTIEVEEPAPEPEAPPEPENPELEAFILECKRGESEMKRLNDNIPGEAISMRISSLTELTGKICAHVRQNPQKLPRAKKFVNYYLPTTIKLLETYDRMGQQGVEGDNISGTMKKVEDILDSIVSAYRKLLDSMFSAEAMDISADIKVMETMLASEGLSDDGQILKSDD